MGKYSENWLYERRRCVERDNRTCQLCGKKREGESRVNVHHIIPVRNFEQKKRQETHKLENLICLCVSCHIKADSKKHYEKLKPMLQLIAIKNTEEFFLHGPLLKSIQLSEDDEQ